jgi:hypothetical protein
MTHPGPDQVAADLALLINPGLRSPRTRLGTLPSLAAVAAERDGGTATEADAIEAVVNRGLAAMTSAPTTTGLPSPRAADPVKALRAALALRPGSERVKSKTRRAAAAQAMGLLSGDGWRAHHEKPLLRDLAAVICAMEATSLAAAHGSGTPSQEDGDPGIARYYGDFVDITSDWEGMFTASSTLDLAIMYGATWRNTYRKNLTALAGRPDGRLRAVLPEPAPSSPLTALYAHTLGITPEDFSGRVTAAIEDFRALGPQRHVEVYLTTTVFRHALYLFTHQAIVALYALCGERIPTPALLASEGRMLAFLRNDFDRLLAHSTRIT